MSVSMVAKGFYRAIVVFGAIATSLGQVASPAAERDGYTAAVHRKDPQAKAHALELFLKEYPQSGLREVALESLLQAYQHTGSPKTTDVLDELLKISPDNLYGLTVKGKLIWGCDDEPRPGMCVEEEAELVNRGLRVLANASKPEYMTESEFAVIKTQAVFIFHSLAGFEALRRGDYSGAQQYLGTAVQVDPASFACVYPLALAYLKSDPPDTVRGLFFIARAAILAPQNSYKAQIVKYGKSEYVKYHGSEQGWTDLMNLAKTSPLIRAGFDITPAH